MTKYVTSKIIINKSIINQIEQSALKALEMTGDYVKGEVIDAQVIPFEVGTLQNSVYTKVKPVSGVVSIVANTPYARRLYYHPEYNFRTEDNPNAKGRWFDDWTEQGKYADDVKKAYAKFFKKLGGL